MRRQSSPLCRLHRWWLLFLRLFLIRMLRSLLLMKWAMHKKEKKDERATCYEIGLRQCRPLLNNPGLQQVLIKLVVSKEESEVAKVIAKATKRPVPVNHGSFTGRTRRAPYQTRGTNFSPRPPSERKCWVCGKAGHISRPCPDKH